MKTRTDFLAQLKKSFPGLQNQPLETLVSENLLSPFTIQLPESVLRQAQKAVEVLFRLRENQNYINSYRSDLDQRNIPDPGNKSICMSYDFHVTADHQIKLIEVNTNASFLALGCEMYKSFGKALPVKDFSMDELRKDIETEVRLLGKTPSGPLKVSIIDEKPPEQRLFIEFLVYQELFSQWGWKSQIQDFRDVNPTDVDFIYNRHTDFFLEGPESATLKKAFQNKDSCFSPNPFEYFLLADKQRMIDWTQAENLAKWQVSTEDQAVIHQVVPASKSLEHGNKDEVWGQRKGYFFKPKNAFGSKQSYKGASISRKAFDELIGQDVIAQEYVPASEQTFPTPTGDQAFKYDLRCYAYQGRLQMITARLYQGQVTNLRTPLGGFGCVEFRTQG
ncbi:hypothetical protein [Bdellovibrio sp. HCB337]|uniref:hypothetical protein n=1 Tax=Bdellovibrio sp. HCB337 TaxID=3394358 RepID=UPI0039A69089